MSAGPARGRVDHYRVEPGDAVGISIRVPDAQRELLVELLAPGVPAELVRRQRGEISLYPTTGRDTLKRRSVGHRWVNVITDPPAGTPDEEAIGGLACIGTPSSPVSRMWRRHGLGRVPGRVSLSVERAPLRARSRIVTAVGTLQVAAAFHAAGERWSVRPQHYDVLTTDPPHLLLGDEWGTRHDGSGRVVFDGPGGRVEFDASVGLDLDLGWDYVLA